MDKENDFYKLWMLSQCGIDVCNYKVVTPIYVSPLLYQSSAWEIKRSQIIDKWKRKISLRNKFIRLGLAIFVALLVIAVCAVSALIFGSGSGLLGLGYGMASVALYSYLSDFYPTQLWQIRVYRKKKNSPKRNRK